MAKDTQLMDSAEYIKSHPYIDSFLSSAQGYDVLQTFMVEFAKLHVEAALKSVAIDIITAEQEKYGTYYQECWDEKVIVKYYPLENIK